MRLALSGRSAASALRAMRAAKVDISRLPKTSLPSPDPSPAKRWTKAAIGDRAWSYAHDGLLEVAVPEARHRIRTSGVTSVVYSSGLPENSYLDIGGGLLIPCPELLFVEMGRHLSPIAHSLFGMELCGTYSRPGTYQLEPVTSAARIREYVRGLTRVNGVHQARSASSHVLDNAWSPMEAIVATLVSLPLYEMGYGIRSLLLNPRGDDPGSRVPDIIVAGTNVGLNYEGEGHLDLASIVSATTEVMLNPQSGSSQEALDETVSRVREKYVDDRRRDRELWSSGHTVFSVTKEDLCQEGAFDSLMLAVYTAVERDTGKDMGRQRGFILDRRFRHERQLRIWSLLPGEVGDRARAELLAEFPTSAPYHDYLIDETDHVSILEIGEGTITF